MIAMDPTALCQRFARRTNVDIAFAVEPKLCPRERAVVTPALSRLLLSHTGMCGMMPAPVTNARNLLIP